MPDKLSKNDMMITAPLLPFNDFPKDPRTVSTESSFKLKCSDSLQKRYILVSLCVLGVLNIYSTRVAINMGLVCMVNHTAVLSRSHFWNFENISNSSYHPNQAHISMQMLNAHPNEDGPFEWDEEIQGLILGSFFLGYVTTQLAGGFLADRYGGKWVFGLALLISSLLTMLTPFAARLSTILLICTRILCGAAQGFSFPALVSILSNWSPVQERARLLAVSLLGIPFGIMISYSLAPFLCTSRAGWPSLFYVIGSFGLIWFALWMQFMYNYPSDHPSITDEEKLYIKSGNMHDHKPYLVKIPWAKLLTSTPVWALAICDFCYAYNFLMLVTQMPTYMKVVLNFSLRENAIYSSIPQLGTPVLALLVSWISDVLISKQKLSVGALRKSATFAVCIISSVCLLGITLLSTQRTGIVALILICFFAQSLFLAGFEMSPFDMSPNFAGTIKGLVHTFAAVGGIVSPYVIGILTKNNNTKTAWDTAFYIVVAVLMFGGITFVLFSSGDIQPWNNLGNTPRNEFKNDDEHLIINEQEKTRSASK